MSDDSCTYAVREETIDGATRYYATFEDSNGVQQEAEIPCEVYLALDQCRLVDKRQVNEVERHWERYELTEGQLAARTLRPPKSMEEAVVQTVDMQAALASLTDAQRRRFLLYHEHGFNMEQIAGVEGCSHPAVLKSIAIAQEKLEKYFSGEGYKTGT